MDLHSYIYNLMYCFSIIYHSHAKSALHARGTRMELTFMPFCGRITMPVSFQQIY